MIRRSLLRLVPFSLLIIGCALLYPISQQADIPSAPPTLNSTDSAVDAPLSSTAVPAELVGETASPPPTQKVVEPPPTLYGIHVYNLDSPGEITLLRQAGGSWTRFDGVNWDLIEPERTEPPTYNWDTVDEQALSLAGENAIQTIAIILFSPAWAQKYQGSACGPVANEALGEFAEFMGSLVNRYSQAPFNLKYWEIGNEPDVDHASVQPRSGFGCWGDSADPYFGGGYYAEMLKAVYPQIKAADPQAQVLVGGLLLDCDPINPPETQPGSGEAKDCTPAKFLEGILASGGGDYFDGVSFHGYDYYAGSLGKYNNGNWKSSWDSSGPVLIAKAGYLRNLLAQYGHPGKYLLNTENAILCGRDGTEDLCQAEEFSLTKAYYLAQAYAAAWAEGLRANIWYSLKGWRASGLADNNLQPNLAYQAFEFSAEQLEGAAYSSEITLFPGIKGYEFTREGDRTWLLWALDDQPHSIALPEIPAAIYDVFGTPLEVSQDLQVTLAPVYIRWAP